MVELDADAGDRDVSFVLSEVVIVLHRPFELGADDDAVVVLLEVPLVVVAIDPVVREVRELAVEFHSALELLLESDMSQLVDMAGSSAHPFEVISGIEDEVRLFLAEEPDHVVECRLTEHLVSDVSVREVAERKRVSRDGNGGHLSGPLGLERLEDDLEFLLRDLASNRRRLFLHTHLQLVYLPSLNYTIFM
jgi:hypothetical protein